MPGYEYGNARLRAMKSRLLAPRQFDELAQVDSLRGLIAALTATPYKAAVEAALARATSMACIREALHIDLLQTLGKIGNFYSDEDRKAVAIVLRTYDIHNLKTVLRGLANNASPAEILASLIPVGQLEYAMLDELARVHGAPQAIDLLASLGSPFARPLLGLRTGHPGAGTLWMELALERWHIQEGLQFAARANGAHKVLQAGLRLDADLTNLLCVLRFACAPEERKHMLEYLGTNEMQSLLVGPGWLPFELLQRAADQDHLDAAVALLCASPAGLSYAAPLQVALSAYARSNRLSEFEQQMRRFRLHWMAGQIPGDPLGIGVVLGYVALKVNEIRNLQWIARAVDLGLTPEAIRAGLEPAG
jgi:V/A-type H+/Na+-transporting ATPase subunit C